MRAIFRAAHNFCEQVYVTGPSTNCCFKEFYIVQVFTHDRINKSTIMSVRSHGLLILC
jgi:hypothetical protein